MYVLLEMSTSNDWRKVGELYRNRDEATKKRNREASESARASPLTTAQPFGFKPRDIERDRKRMKCEATLARIPINLDDEEAMAMLLKQERAGGTHLADVVMLAKALRARRLQEERRGKEDDEKLVETDQASRTPIAIAKLMQEFPKLKDVRDRLVAQPPQFGFQIFDVKHSSAAEDSEMFLKWLEDKSENSRTSVGSIIDELWQMMHTVQQGRPQDLVPEPEPSLCWVADMCVHTPQGQRRLQCRNSILRALKTGFPRNDVEKRFQLGNGELFMVFEGRTMLSTKVWSIKHVLSFFVGVRDRRFRAKGMIAPLFSPSRF